MPNNHIITILGRGVRNRKSPELTGRYLRATYGFSDGHQSQPRTFFGLALLTWLRRQPTGPKPNSLIFLGTRDSMWDGLAELIIDAEATEDSEAVLQLFGELEGQGAVEQSQLDDLAIALQEHLRAVGQRGLQVRLMLISTAATAIEQLTLVRDLAELVAPGDGVWLDVTHGLRHQGTILTSAASYLTHVRKGVTVHGVFYGAYELRSGEAEHPVAPVVRLDALERLQAWISAMDRFDATGDYGAMAPVLLAEGHEDLADRLERAAFLERTFQTRLAQEELHHVTATMERNLNTASAPGSLTALFAPHLIGRLRGTGDATQLAAMQRVLASKGLGRGEFVTAVAYLFEAWVTTRCEQLKKDATSFEERKEARQSLRCPAYHDLRILRNALVHGLAAHGTDQRQERGERWPRAALRDRETLTKALKQLLQISATGCAGGSKRRCSHGSWFSSS